MTTHDKQNALGPPAIVLEVCATTVMTSYLDQSGERVCVKLPTRAQPVLLAATEAGAEELIAVLIGGLRDLRAIGGQQHPDRPRRGLSTVLASEIASVTDGTEEP
ncbi:hypothetical protein [Kutzneria sp. 744]|uniref:hypothetical protein n=1 Tax=Kutzneria sp. (strain 744) TaxID=345341 RepID=UPI0003EEAF30|nr:hypothetical protein [Kutzneria sp. 744]EWM19852.1 hypothetical protein KUTG_10156 [Kutzneria sp. 744]